MVLLLCTSAASVTAGIPVRVAAVIAMICGIIGLRPEGIAIILGVNTFLDMCRTSLNVTRRPRDRRRRVARAAATSRVPAAARQQVDLERAEAQQDL
jgi:hypothetical protein